MIPSATARPSIWWNIGRWVASIVSRRKALPGTATKIGGPWASIARICIGEVWVRSITSSSSGVSPSSPTSALAFRAASTAALLSDPGAT